MSDDSIPTTWTQAADKAVLGVCEVAALLFALPFGDALYNGKPILTWHWALLTIGVAIALFGPFWPIIRLKLLKGKETTHPLAYLQNKDSEFGWAIQAMARNSAWGKWYAAQSLVNSGTPIREGALLNVACSIITENLLDGDLRVRGRTPGKMDYEEIPQTHWRSSGLFFHTDSILGSKLVILPRGSVELDGAGAIVKASNPDAMQRTDFIRNYDSLIIDGAAFEKLWPKNEWDADKKRFRFLREARRRKLDESEIKKLSRDWNPLFSVLWIK